MKENEDKLIEKLVDIMIKDSKLEQPSLDFTAKVMSQVLTTKTSQVFVYKPLISKYVFILVFGCFITLSFYSEPQTDSWISILSFCEFFNKNSTALFSFSKITTYAVVLATIMFVMQIYFFKKYFENQLNATK